MDNRERNELELKYFKRVVKIVLTFLAAGLSLPLIIPLYLFNMEFKIRLSMWAASVIEELDEIKQFIDEDNTNGK